MNLNSINNKPTCDNECDLFGWTHEYIIVSNDNTLNMHVSIHPDADIDTSLVVFDHDGQECICIRGWLWGWERING
jgi:hypothetical protein